MTGMLDKESHLNHSDDNWRPYGPVDSDEEQDGCYFKRSYSIDHLTMLDDQADNEFSSLKVDFETEVFPEERLKGLKQFKTGREPTGNEGTTYEKFYRCAALLVFRKDELLPVLIRGKLNHKAVQSLFFRQFKKCENQLSDENVKKHLLKWTHAIVATPVKDEQRLLEILSTFDNIELLQKFVEVYPVNDSFANNVLGFCQKYGWLTLSKQICSRILTLNVDQKVKILETFAAHQASDGEAEKFSMIHRVIAGMLQSKEFKFSELTHSWQREYQIKHMRKAIVSLWPLATKVKFSMAEYAKSNPLEVIVPALVQLASKAESNKQSALDPIWLEVSNDFVCKMKDILATPPPTLTWRQNVNVPCTCKECAQLDGFLKNPNLSTVDIMTVAAQRNHLTMIVQKLNKAPLRVEWQVKSRTIMRVTKSRQTGQEKMDERNKVSTFLAQLEPVIPSTPAVA